MLRRLIPCKTINRRSAPIHLRPTSQRNFTFTGCAPYTDDINELQGTVYCALGLSEHAHARIVNIDFDAVETAPGVLGVLTAADIIGPNNCGPIVEDDPILAEEFVYCIGQPVFAVIAESNEAARRAARRAVIEYEPLTPVLCPREAHKRRSYVVPPMQLRRGDPQTAIRSAPHRLKGEFAVGGQEQFYLEGQISYAIPRENNALLVYCSTQHPTEMQHLVAHALGIGANQVTIELRRMGGGFGGKESQSSIFACIAALAAYRFGRPVKLRLDRDDDFLATGKRHDFYYDYEVGYDASGKICAAKVDMILRAGYSTDLSPPVATRAICHFDNAYYLSDVEINAYCARTNTQSNTAFRGFGGPQGALIMEYILDNIARERGLDPLSVRRTNFYGAAERNRTPYGQLVEDNILRELTDHLEVTCEYQRRRAATREFNEHSPIIKRGIAFTPVKFGISFNVVHFNQAGALVHVYTDGSILINHGGTEMGQGLHTKIAQVVAHELGVSIERIRATATVTDKIANTSATAASTGSDLNGKAAQFAAAKIKDRLAHWAAERYSGEAANVIFANDQITVGAHTIGFAEAVAHAYVDRVQLWADGFYKTPKLHWDANTLTGRPFFYYAYGAAVSEVAIDTLTGEWKLRRVDLLNDAGQSLNPAIDIGQTEGAFIQGMGWLTLEELWWNSDGRLQTHAPSTYKIPAVSDCPAEFYTELFHNPNREETILRSKAVGEPPLLLAFSVWFAIRDALASLADYRIDPPLRAPATPEAILDASVALQSENEKKAAAADL